MIRVFVFTGAVGPHIASQSDLLAHPSLRLRYRASHLFAKNSPPDCFLNAKTLLGFKSPLITPTKKEYLYGILFLLVEHRGFEPLTPTLPV